MRKIGLILLVAMVSPLWAVNTLTENFDGPAMGFTVNSAGTQGSGTVGSFDGAGHYVMTKDSYIYRWVNVGDFNMQTVFNSIDMGTPTGPVETDYRTYTYLINHTGDNHEQLVVFFQKNATSTQFAVNTVFYDSGTSSYVSTSRYGEALASLTSATLEVQWNESAHTYVVSAGFNGGAISQKVSLNMFGPSNLNRHDYFYGVSIPLTAGQPSFSLDKYEMTVPAAPAVGQIESFDNVSGAGWLAGQGAIAQETTIKQEGTGSMKLVGGTGNVEAYKYYTAPLDMTPAAGQYVQFWCYGDGSANPFQLILIDTTGAAARYIDYISWTGWRPIVVKADLIGKDSSFASFNYASVGQIHFFVEGLTTRGDVYVDDLRVEAAPTISMEMSYCEPNSPYVYQIGSYSGASHAYDTAVKTEGASSLAMNFTTSAAYQQVCIYLTQYLNNGAPNVGKDFTKFKYVEFDLYGDGSGNRLEVHFQTGGYAYYKWIFMDYTGWKHYKIARTEFASQGGTANWASIDSLRFFNPDSTAMAIKLDNVTATNTPDPSLAWVMNAQKATITVDGNAAEWAALTDSDEQDFDLKLVPNQPNGDLHAKYKFAWDNDYLYVLVQEVAGDNEAYEAEGLADLNDGAGGDVLYDSLALFYDFTNTQSPDAVPSSIALWQFLAFSSTGRTDMMMTWTNGEWGPHKSGAMTNGSMATSGTLGSRVIEAKLKWSDLAAELTSDRQPAGGLAAAIQPGYVFGCDPRLGDREGYAAPWSNTATIGCAWMNGKLWSPGVPNGRDVYSTDVKLVCKAADLTGDCSVDMDDFAELSAEWASNDCSDLNAYCAFADIVMDGQVNISDLAKLVSQWLQ